MLLTYNYYKPITHHTQLLFSLSQSTKGLWHTAYACHANIHSLHLTAHTEGKEIHE